jgi:hypothetical protein
MDIDGKQLPIDILFILILCFHILILMLARCRSKLRQFFRKRWLSLDKSAIAEQQPILIEPHILDNTHAFVYIFAEITAVYPRKRPTLR